VPRRLFYRLHARQQMAERGIAPADVRAVLSSGRLIHETHHLGRPFPTQIWLGRVGERALHVVLAVDLAGAQYVITVYEPDPEQWNASLDERKER
jgi:hypothetical protein